MKFHKLLGEETGFTLVETLVASAILLGVLIPAILFFGKITMNHFNQDLLTATHLARAEMERTTTFSLFENEQKNVQSGKRQWLVKRIIQKDMGLVEIHIQVFRANQTKPIVEFKNRRLSR